MVRAKYYTQNEIAVHYSSDDLWVSFLGKVYDLTPLIEKHKGSILLKPILQAGGKDLSHWFDAKTGELRTYVDPETSCIIPYAPHGLFIHVPPPYPTSDWANDFGRPWWKDDSYCIGLQSQKTRSIKIINTLTSQQQILEVCSEETMEEILERHLSYNAHAASYTWKYEGRVLDMDKTLEENDIHDDDEAFYKAGMDDDEFQQAILLYFNDDLTEG